MPGRQAGGVTAAGTESVREVRRGAVRCRRAKGQWKRAVWLSTGAPDRVLARTGRSAEPSADPEAVVLGDVYFYDQRGGGVETSLKGDQPGLGMRKRNQKRFEAQQLLVPWNALGHNVLVWARGWLEAAAPLVGRSGIQRLVRDVLGISGAVETDSTGRVDRIVLNQASRRAQCCLSAFQLLLGPPHLVVSLGQT